MLHEERNRKKDIFAASARRKVEMKELEMIALALLNLKHQPTSEIWQKRISCLSSP